MKNFFEALKAYLLRKKVTLHIILLFGTAFYFSLPGELFEVPCSTIIEDRNGELLSARIASDGQWRFPEIDSVPEKFREAIIQFEDSRFMLHPGVDPLAVGRAFQQNISTRKISSGGSTLTMQVIRLSRKGRSRTVIEKVIEAILAVRLECSKSKAEILKLYASHAPFGGNVVGIEAAAWRYFGRSPGNLSWAEAATLAVLPNSPNLIYPGKNSGKLLQKRNRLLKKLYEKGRIEKLTYELSLQEELPSAPHKLPMLAGHLLDRCIAEGQQGKRIRTTIDRQLQLRAQQILSQHHERLKANEVHNAACLIIEPSSGEVLSYIGNILNDEGCNVDLIRSPRSTGSILKPFLYAAMLKDGMISPESLIPDIPTQISGFAPKNFNLTYDGALPARRALARSLNIPAVKMLQSYGIEKFHHLLKKAGMSTIKFHPDHYGLSLILGGAEGTLWDITSIYSSMAQQLNNKKEVNPHFIPAGKSSIPKPSNPSPFDKASSFLAFEAMEEVSRPDAESGYKLFSSGRKVAWKTGTSFGFRDAWAVGATPGFVVGIWAGNADGEGRPELTGIASAAPILFDIFGILPETQWFQVADKEFTRIKICRQSGYISLDICPDKVIMKVPTSGTRIQACPYHRLVHLNESRTYRVNRDCEEMIHTDSFFVLPPALEWYYKRNDPNYKVLPPFKPGCIGQNEDRNMEFIYPRDAYELYIPVGLNGEAGKMVAELAHRRPANKVHWHIDNVFVKTTSGIHQLGFNPGPGAHTITAVDENGESISQSFSIIEDKK